MTGTQIENTQIKKISFFNQFLSTTLAATLATEEHLFISIKVPVIIVQPHDNHIE
jgi:hypothetical protein